VWTARCGRMRLARRKKTTCVPTAAMHTSAHQGHVSRAAVSKLSSNVLCTISTPERAFSSVTCSRRCKRAPEERCAVGRMPRLFAPVGACMHSPPPATPARRMQGASYRGTQNTTKNGYTCQRWDVTTPNFHTRIPSAFPTAGLVNNYCRNPDNEDQAWCYTTDGPRWEYCGIPFCAAAAPAPAIALVQSSPPQPQKRGALRGPPPHMHLQHECRTPECHALRVQVWQWASQWV
jgi:hypothetical protein